MRKALAIILSASIALFFFSLQTYSHAIELTLSNAPVGVYFSPKGGCTEAIIKEIDKAKSEILVQAYSFTSAPIAAALTEAHKRGVHVEIILDKSNKTAKYSSADFTAHAGIPTFIDAEHAIAHNKIIIIDRETVITGSFNFTNSAEKRTLKTFLSSSQRNWQRYMRIIGTAIGGIRKGMEGDSKQLHDATPNTIL